MVAQVLLAFRTAQSYDRFWAGRQLWAEVANAVRNLGRLAATGCKEERYEALQGHLMAFPVAFRRWPCRVAHASSTRVEKLTQASTSAGSEKSTSSRPS